MFDKQWIQILKSILINSTFKGSTIDIIPLKLSILQKKKYGTRCIIYNNINIIICFKIGNVNLYDNHTCGILKYALKYKNTSKYVPNMLKI